ncbi:MAG: cadherin-like domain-containing protein, partial [Candidatus Thioglobus sp.]|nr:cadherin-like domain-containing protein [Candidatus Thioglobus sp.]
MSSKGPFVAGSTVSAYVLTNGIRGKTLETTATTGILGVFEFANLLIGSSTELEISGFYLNENTGNTSTSTATLTVIVDVASGTNSFNINIFTDLEARRIKALTRKSNNLVTSKNSATELIVTSFGLQNADRNIDLSQLDVIYGITENDRILLRASAVIANNPSILIDLQTAASGTEDFANSIAGARGLASLNAGIEVLDLAKIAEILANLSGNSPSTDLTDFNSAPIISPISPRTVAEDSNSQFPLIIPMNVVSDSADLSFSASSENPEIATVRVENSPGISNGSEESAVTSNAGLHISLKPNAHGSTTIFAAVTDNKNGLNVTQFVLTVTPVNDPPAAQAQAITVAEEGSVRIILAATDVDNDDNLLTFSIATQPTNGSITGSGGSLTYTPNANFSGADAFTFTANDGNLSSAPATISIAVIPENDRPSGNLSISGTAVIGQTLSANSTITDADGLGVFIYQWQKNGRNINGATDASLALTTANVSVGDEITLRVSYTDAAGRLERPPSSAAVVVIPVVITITSAVSVIRGSTLILAATVAPSGLGNSASDIVWSLRNNNNVASLNGNVLSGLNPGTVNVIATAADGATKQQAFTV